MNLKNRATLWILSIFQISQVSSYELDVSSKDSISQVAQKVAFKLMQFYPGNKTGGIPGLFGDPYYWWEAGAVFGALVDYWAYTQDAGYNQVTTEALLHQVGPNENYMPPNQSKSLGNDDQCFWALTTISAAEKRFPNPPAGSPQWLALTQAVFNTQAARWDPTTCAGGLRWQIFPFNNGYTYKNTISTGCFFQLAARLARYTRNETYAGWAETAFDWTYGAGLATQEHRFLDGAEVDGGECGGINRLQWSYNAGIYLAGAAYMYNYTNGDVLWKERIDGILEMALEEFFTRPPTGPENVMFEVACEPYLTCNVDQRSFKAYLARFLALTVKMAPFTTDLIMPRLRASAIAAARHCAFGDDGNTCGQKWYVDGWDGMWGVGEQISALEVIQNTLVAGIAGPVTQEKGGISNGNPAAGGKHWWGGSTGGGALSGDGRDSEGWVNGEGVFVPHHPSRKDKVGAATTTVLLVLFTLGLFWWVSTGT